jgi:3-oxoacyl-[acyl-carrier-protein] synthase-3
MRAIINGVGSYIPEVRVKNEDFLKHQFHSDYQKIITEDSRSIIRKFEKITGISERRYVSEALNNDDISLIAAERALKQSTIDKEELDYVIVAHNYGNVEHGSNRSDFMPSLATRVKHRLGIRNNNCVAYDIVFGCPGWVEAMIQSTIYIQSGQAKNCLVIGSETLSRVVDPADRDSMIFADGAGACVLSGDSTESKGVLGFASQTFSFEEADFLYNAKSFGQQENQQDRFIKMQGRKIYEFALNRVPIAMKMALEKSGVTLKDLKKVLLHQANEKMDEAIIQRFYKLYEQETPLDIMPMSIHLLGNSSVATVPTLLDLILQGKLEGHEIHSGDCVMMASVGAGMNINAFVYRF